VKFPLLTGFCGGLVIFAGCAYLGDYGSTSITYRWRKPMSFQSLQGPNDGQLRENLLTLQTVAFSQFREDSQPALQKAADYFATIRSTRSAELQPLLDLQIATYNLEIARLERNAGNPTGADHHEQMALTILRSLGWQDTSSEKLARLTVGKLWWKRTK
jgi:hypothetical protein